MAWDLRCKNRINFLLYSCKLPQLMEMMMMMTKAASRKERRHIKISKTMKKNQRQAKLKSKDSSKPVQYYKLGMLKLISIQTRTHLDCPSFHRPVSLEFYSIWFNPELFKIKLYHSSVKLTVYILNATKFQFYNLQTHTIKFTEFLNSNRKKSNAYQQ